MDFSAKLVLPYLLPNQAEKHVSMNDSLRVLDALVQLSVISATLIDPPATPTDGDRYIPAENSLSDWQGQDGQVASFQEGAWYFHAPQPGWLAWVEEETKLIVFDGAAWIEAGSSSSAEDPDRLGINTSADDVNRFSLRSAASLFSNDGSGHQIKVNKATETDTASLLFQSNWAGHAELGLTGSNDFQIKTSPDGGQFSSALSVRADTGYVGIGTAWPEATLQVEGAIKMKLLERDELPDAQVIGAGGLVFVNDSGVAKLAFSNGQAWRWTKNDSAI